MRLGEQVRSRLSEFADKALGSTAKCSLANVVDLSYVVRVDHISTTDLEVLK